MAFCVTAPLNFADVQAGGQNARQLHWRLIGSRSVSARARISDGLFAGTWIIALGAEFEHG